MSKARTLANLVSGASTSTLPNSALTNSSLTINSQSVSLGGSVNISTITRPTFSSVTPSTIPPNAGTSVTIAGTGFQSVPIVEAIKSDTGAITRAASVSFTSATSIAANLTLTATGTYFIRIENNDGGSVRSGSASLTASSAPTFSTAAGTLGTLAKAQTVNTSVSASSDSNITYSETTSVLTSNSNTPASTMNLSLNSSTGAITGTAPSPTNATTYNFTIRATDQENQSADRNFSFTISPNYFGDGSDGALNTTP